MSQPTVSDVHVNKPLTDIAIAYVQSQTNFLAEQLAPSILVDKRTDIYPLWTKDDWMRDDAKPRVSGAAAAMSGINLDTSKTYHCKRYALADFIGDDVMNNEDAGLEVAKAKMLALVQKLMISKERLLVSSLLATSVWGTDKTGGTHFTVWSNSASDPQSDVDTGKSAILKSTGSDPNTLVLGHEVFMSLRRHPVIKESFKYTSDQGLVTKEQLAAFFDVEKVLVSKAVYSSTPEGASSPTQAFILGKHALLAYVNPAPSKFAPSAAYNFSWKWLSGNSQGLRIKQYRDEKLDGDVIEAEWAYDFKAVGTDLGYFFSGAVA